MGGDQVARSGDVATGTFRIRPGSSRGPPVAVLEDEGVGGVPTVGRRLGARAARGRRNPRVARARPVSPDAMGR